MFLRVSRLGNHSEEIRYNRYNYTKYVEISCRKMFYLYQTFVAFFGFSLFSPEICVGWIGPGDGVSLSAIVNSKLYAVAGRRDQNSLCRTLLMRVAFLCPTLVRFFLLSLGWSAGLRILDGL